MINYKNIKLAISIILFLSSFFMLEFSWYYLAALTLSYLLSGSEILLKAVKDILRGKVFTENFLMSIATIGAIAVSEHAEGVAVMIFYKIGMLFEDMAVNRSVRSIKALMEIRPDYANLISGSEIKRVHPDEVAIGQMILVKPGERVPIDGNVISGRSTIDLSAITGESKLKDVDVGDVIFSGSVNTNGLLEIETIKLFKDSTVSKILELVQNATNRKSDTEKFITQFARYYTPAVTFTAIAIAVVPSLLLPGAVFEEWFYRGLVFLVISCPCALVLSIPMGFFGGIGGASRRGILVKGSNYLEALSKINTVVLDKTGTLTYGRFKVSNVFPENGFDQKSLLKLAAYAESNSNHPIALAILESTSAKIEQEKIKEHYEMPGRGVRVIVDGDVILAGNSSLMREESIKFNIEENDKSLVFIAVNSTYAGCIELTDEIRENSGKAVKLLRKYGIKKIVMLTGDTKEAAFKVSNKLGLDETHYGLLPDQKVKILDSIREQQTDSKIAFVGDGINDAPVLAFADVGIAMGGIGSDAAIEASDVVLMTDDPMKIVESIKIAKRTKRIVWQNIVFSLGTKGIVMLFGMLGFATMWGAVFADVGVALIAVFNSLRALKMEKI